MIGKGEGLRGHCDICPFPVAPAPGTLKDMIVLPPQPIDCADNLGCGRWRNLWQAPKKFVFDGIVTALIEKAVR